jgi:hypothetical protein
MLVQRARASISYGPRRVSGQSAAASGSVNFDSSIGVATGECGYCGLMLSSIFFGLVAPLDSSVNAVETVEAE